MKRMKTRGEEGEENCWRYYCRIGRVALEQKPALGRPNPPKDMGEEIEWHRGQREAKGRITSTIENSRLK
jgi:hypothetical protein